jgi:hypothetical protein
MRKDQKNRTDSQSVEYRIMTNEDVLALSRKKKLKVLCDVPKMGKITVGHVQEHSWAIKEV